MAAPSTEPFALAVYADGTVITATGSGSIADPFPSLTIGRVANCRVGWEVAEFTRLAAAEMGQPAVTDQGTTVVTVQPMGAQPSSVSVYALGVGDGLVQAAQHANRVALQSAMDRMTTAGSDRRPWLPERLRIMLTSDGKNIPDHTWPGPVTLQTLKGGMSAGGCAVVEGETAANVVGESAGSPVLGVWTEPGHKTMSRNTYVIGVLISGQSGCDG